MSTTNATQLKLVLPMQTTRYNIDTCSMLVELNTSVWTARQLDKGTTDELVHNKNAASKDAARVNKNLLAGRKELDIIVQHVGKVRNNFVYPNTLPWSDTGIRLLPTARFMGFNQRMVEEEETFWELVKEFVAIYPSLITAQAMALGDMFKRDDYPDAAEIERRFGFNVNYIPVPTSGDFRVDVGNAAMQELQEKYDKYTTERVEAAMLDVRTRLKEHLLRMSDRLTMDTSGGEIKTRRFHDSLLDTGLELCDLVKGLNIVGDYSLEQARASLERALSGVSVDDLRKNVAVRRDVKKEVDTILSSMTW